MWCSRENQIKVLGLTSSAARKVTASLYHPLFLAVWLTSVVKYDVVTSCWWWVAAAAASRCCIMQFVDRIDLWPHCNIRLVITDFTDDRENSTKKGSYQTYGPTQHWTAIDMKSCRRSTFFNVKHCSIRDWASQWPVHWTRLSASQELKSFF